MRGSDERRPNVLLIVADQHRADCVGALGLYPIRTPHLDALAASGTLYTSAFTPIPLCVPARQALLTGARPERFGGLWNYDQGPLVQALSPEAYSWPRELQRLGYWTQYLGQWHVNPDHGPTAFGYERYVGLEAYEEWRKEHFPGLSIGEGWLGAVDPVPVEKSRTHWFAAEARKFIEQASTRPEPWHLRLDFVEPHLPCTPCAEFASQYLPEAIPAWPGARDPLVGKPYIQRQQRVTWGVAEYTWEDWAPMVARYYAVISQLDDAVGRVLGALRETGQDDSTFVIYTSDHGDMCGSHGMIDKHYVMYDDVVRVPLIVRLPGSRAPSGRVDDFVVNALDLPVTITEAAGLPPPPGCRGRILPRGDDREPLASALSPRAAVVSTYNGQQFGLYSQRMIRTREWKYVWNATDVDELYDLQHDPAELINRIADDSVSGLVADLRATLYAELIDEGDRLVANPWLRSQFLTSSKLSR